MLESRYWKEELQRIAKTLQKVCNPKRWSERSVCIVERDLMIGFFIVRKLTELHKISSRTKKSKLRVVKYKRTKSNISLLNQWDLDEHYDLEDGVKDEKFPEYIINQFIHSTISFVVRDETRNWHSVIIVSDYDRNKFIWRVPVSEIRKLFLTTSEDCPETIYYVFDKEKNDHKVSTE